MGYDVFISYSREDRPKVTKLAQAFEQKGLKVWFDSKIQAGAGFRTEIAQALAASKLVVVIWSEHSVASRFVCDEADEGAARDVLFPALISAVEIPLGFRQIQTADLTRWRGKMNDPALLAFVDTVNKGARGKLGTPPRPAPIPQPAPERVPEPEPEPVAQKPKVKPKKEKPQKAPRAERAERPARSDPDAKYTVNVGQQRAGLMFRSLLLTALAAAGFGAIAYGSGFVFEAYRPAFIAALAALAFLSRYGTFQADRASGMASLHLLSRSYLALVFFSLILLAPIIMQGRIYAAALEGVQVRGIEGADINGVSLDASGKRLLTSSDDGTVRVWDVDTGVQRAIFKGHAAPEDAKPENHWVWGAEFSPDGSMAVSASRDLTARIWRTNIVSQIFELKGHTRSVLDAAWQPGGEVVATASNDATIILWDPSTGEQVRVLRGHDSGINAIEFSPDGEILASASDDGTIRLWNWREGRRINSAGAGGGEVEDVHFSHDGKRLVAMTENGRARVWTVDGLSRVGEVQHGGPGYSAVFAGIDGAAIATGGIDGVIRLWNLADGALLREFTGHKDGVRTLDSTADGAKIISGSRDNTARVWDVETGKEIQTMGHVKPAIELPVAIDLPPWLSASRAPVPMDFKASPGAAVELLGKGALVAAALAIAALLLKGVFWVIGLRPLARRLLSASLFAAAGYTGVLMLSALPLEALWLWLTLAFVPAALLATGRWLVLGPVLGGNRRKKR